MGAVIATRKALLCWGVGTLTHCCLFRTRRSCDDWSVFECLLGDWQLICGARIGVTTGGLAAAVTSMSAMSSPSRVPFSACFAVPVTAVAIATLDVPAMRVTRAGQAAATEPASPAKPGLSLPTALRNASRARLGSTPVHGLQAAATALLVQRPVCLSDPAKPTTTLDSV